jgi:cell division protein FtsL
MQKERAAEEEINRHLRLENETLRAPARIEKLAIERLHMVAPGPDEAAVIERVLPTTPPPRSVVARR